jgi:hypothetical protein
MKETRLVCDWCPGPVRPDAVTLLTLANGHATRGVLAADLCKKCTKRAQKLFRRRPATQPHPAGGASEGKTGPTHQGVLRGQIKKEKILAVATTPMKKVEIAAKAGLNDAITNWHIKQLVEDGQLKKIGRGNTCRYVRA